MIININILRNCFGCSNDGKVLDLKGVRERMNIITDHGFDGIRENNPGWGQFHDLESWAAGWLPEWDLELVSEANNAGLHYQWQLCNANEGIEEAASPKVWEQIKLMNPLDSRMTNRRKLIAGSILANYSPVLNWLIEWAQKERARLAGFKNLTFEGMNVDIPKYSDAVHAAQLIKQAANLTTTIKSSSAFTTFAKKLSPELPKGCFVYENKAVGFNMTPLADKFVTEAGWDLRKINNNHESRFNQLFETVIELKRLGITNCAIHSGVDAGHGNGSSDLSHWIPGVNPLDPYSLFADEYAAKRLRMLTDSAHAPITKIEVAAS